MRCDANALLHCLPPQAASQLTQTQLGPPPLAGISTRRGCCTDREVYASGGEAMTGGRQAGSFTNETHGRGRSCPRRGRWLLQTHLSRTLCLNRCRAIFFLLRILHCSKSPRGCRRMVRSRVCPPESLPASKMCAPSPSEPFLGILSTSGWAVAREASPPCLLPPTHTHHLTTRRNGDMCVCNSHTAIAIHVRVIFIPQSLCASVHQGTHMHARAHTRRTCPSHVGWRGALPVSTMPPYHPPPLPSPRCKSRLSPGAWDIRVSVRTSLPARKPVRPSRYTRYVQYRDSAVRRAGPPFWIQRRRFRPEQETRLLL